VYLLCLGLLGLAYARAQDLDKSLTVPFDFVAGVRRSPREHTALVVSFCGPSILAIRSDDNTVFCPRVFDGDPVLNGALRPPEFTFEHLGNNTFSARLNPGHLCFMTHRAMTQVAR